jgi:hypothetical protein
VDQPPDFSGLVPVGGARYNERVVTSFAVHQGADLERVVAIRHRVAVDHSTGRLVP